jgi:hypothetical protein
MEDMPNANDIHEHISGMLDGKLGKLAREIAEETAEGLNIDMENVTDMKGVFNNLIKNEIKNILTLRDINKVVKQDTLDFWNNKVDNLFKKALENE